MTSSNNIEKLLYPDYERFDRSGYDNILFAQDNDPSNKVYSNIIIDIDLKNKINLKENNNKLNYEIINKNTPKLCNDLNILQLRKPTKILNYNIINDNKASIDDYPKLRNDFKYFYLFIITQIDRVTFNLYLSIVNYIHYDTTYQISDFIKVFKKLYNYLYIVKDIINDKPNCKKKINILNKQTKIINLIDELETKLK
jgi:hypothetical protein